MENLVGSESSSSSQDFSELGKPEGRYQLLLGKSFFYVPDTGVCPPKTRFWSEWENLGMPA